MRQLLCVGAVLFLTMGCGQGGSGGDDASSSVPGVTLTGLRAVPDTVAFYSGESAALAVLATYSDGTESTVVPAWNNSDPEVVALSSTGMVSMADAVATGSAILTGVFGGLTAPVAVTVHVEPLDEELVYGAGYTGLLHYPGPGLSPVNFYPSDACYSGFTMDRSKKHLYVTEWTDAGYQLHRFDARSRGDKGIIALPTIDRPFGLDSDSQGRILMQGFGDGKVFRFDPATGNVEELTGISSQADMAVGADDRLYSSRFFNSVGSPWITYQGAYGFTMPWAMIPSSVTGIGTYGIVLPAGLAMNSSGEAFIQDMNGTRLYRHRDINGDGDALDGGETDVFATFAGSWDENFTYGIAVTRGRGVLVNRKINENTGTGAANAGLYWVKDLDNDGNATDADEQVLHSSDTVDNGIDGGCVAAPR